MLAVGILVALSTAMGCSDSSVSDETGYPINEVEPLLALLERQRTDLTIVANLSAGEVAATVTNNGPVDAFDITLSIDLPAGVSLDVPVCIVSDLVATCVVAPYIASGDTISVVLPLQISDAGPALPQFSITVSSYENPVDNDPNPDDNVVHVRPPADTAAPLVTGTAEPSPNSAG